MSADKYTHTFNTWNKVAQAYQDIFMDVSDYSDSYDFFLEQLPIDSHILEIGCGPGNITAYINANRPDLKILAIDVAPAMVGLAKQNVPAAEFEIMDCREISSITGTYDGIICGFCIPYLNKEDCGQFLTDAVSKMNAGGIMYLSFISGNYDDSGFQISSTGDGTYVYYYNEAFLEEQCRSNNLNILKLFKKEIERRGKMSSEMIYVLELLR